MKKVYITPSVLICDVEMRDMILDGGSLPPVDPSTNMGMSDDGSQGWGYDPNEQTDPTWPGTGGAFD
ncbi:MAG: hypothetical protein HUK04_03550 [Bacteroidaceae bacterium]|nr:hypothetical protein [Bacteroidaceae bacterium]